MAWIVGLDEAGYGPNLGPLVLASSACRVLQAPDRCLWSTLEAVARRHGERDASRLLVDDSKKVNQGPNGLARLELGVWVTRPARPATLVDWLAACSLGDSLADLRAEPWFTDTELPVRVAPAELDRQASIWFAECVRAGVEFAQGRAVVIPPPRFNHLLDRWQLKSGVLATGVMALLQDCLSLPGDDEIHIAVDKLGGRNFYAPLLSEAFPDGWVRVRCEGADLCEYEITGLARRVVIRFMPRADGTHLNVALASMTAKYLREVLMLQFNRYWQRKVPGIEPTAGYPVDAARFLKQIERTLHDDGTALRTVWRSK